jgi:hypothetical protein
MNIQLQLQVRDEHDCPKYTHTMAVQPDISSQYIHKQTVTAVNVVEYSWFQFKTN